ncbi:hypothetical protein YC2023_051239 [Brassica napus]
MVDLQESEDEKPAPKAKQDTKSAKKDSSSDKSGSDESESEDEEETPKKTCSDVEMVDAEMKQSDRLHKVLEFVSTVHDLCEDEVDSEDEYEENTDQWT